MCYVKLKGNRIFQNEVTRMKKLKPCPFRVHGERRESLTVAGEFFYNETFMPCMGEECACFTEDSVDAYCDRNGAFMRMTKEVTE